MSESVGIKRRKRQKEARPHPSYRLNKRYWDDIRAGRRPQPRSGLAAIAGHRAKHHHHQLSTLLPDIAAAQMQACLPYSLLNPPMISMSSLPFSFPNPLSLQLQGSSSNSLFCLSPQAHRAFESSSTFEKKPSASTSSHLNDEENADQPVSAGLNGDIGTAQTASDEFVDQLADQMMRDMIGREASTTKTPAVAVPKTEKTTVNPIADCCILPIPLPLIFPLLIPVTDEFILKYYSR